MSALRPGVDRLVGVADHAQVPVRLRYLLGDGVLDHVGVLELVDHELGVPALIPLGHVRNVVKQLVDLQEQVVEVDGGALREEPFIDIVHPVDDLVVGVLLCQAEGLSVEQLALCARDGGQYRLGSERLGVHAGVFHGALDHGDLVRVVVDDEAPVQPDPVARAAQHGGAEGVKRGDGETLRVLAEQEPKAVAHLARRLVGERHGGDTGRIDAAVADEVGDAVSDDSESCRCPAPR